MLYKLRVSHIREDFTITDEHAEVWTRTVENPSELKLILNRIAIATTQYPVVEFPEVLVRWDSHHAQIRAIRGKLYYTELKSNHRRDIVVTPDEVIRLLQGQPVEQALGRNPDEDEDAYTRPVTGGGLGARRSKNLLLTVALILFSASVVFSWNQLREHMRLMETPQFVPMKEEEGRLLRQYADVYLHEFREGSTVLKLTEDGRLLMYELWYAPQKKMYDLVPVGSYPVVAGLHRGEPALLAGEMHLLQLAGDRIFLHGIAYERHGKELSALGDVRRSGF